MRNTEINPRDQYLETLFAPENELKKQSRQAAEDLGLARISLSASEGLLLSTLLKIHQSKKVVEIGTLTGLSAQYIFESLPVDGQLWTFEKNLEHADRSQKIFVQIPNAENRLHLIVGDAKEKLEEINSQGPFDAVFIDGNKAAYGDYLAWTEKHLRKGGLIMADNVFLAGAVWGGTTAQKFNEKQIQVLRKFNERLADASLYDSMLVPTYEGLFVAVKRF